MYLSRVRVRNYRKLSHIDVDLKPGLNIILGENNVGKTCLLSAIRIALSGGTNDRLSASKDDLPVGSDGKL